MNFDLRITHNARFMDQKVTPDVLSCISECIVEFIQQSRKNEFYINDIKNLPYSHYLIKDIFNKPDLESAPNEYDKFFSQPIKTLAYAGILQEIKQGNKNMAQYNLSKF